ncbi:subtilisin-like protein [Polychaeton citri CBS 116435]|uniref:Subtilisin-like protein n=1 Tax=Polychaeton citri CBS 116435 TaxID=1314669 RepID=A0A9P4QEQ2_9PEZI|nr:subtilisin-like protein [Polychaeton citri CBS 116435]
MRLSNTLLLAASTLATSVLSLRQDVAPRVPGAYIVEYTQDESTDAFYSSLGQAGHAVSHRLDLKYNLFKGVSFQLQNVSSEKEAVQKIQAMSQVKNIWPVRIYNVPKDEVVWTGKEKVAPSAAGLQKRQSGNSKDTFSPHVMTQVDKLRAEGVTGKGVRVAVIDTGVDYHHPALGGCFGEGCLVAFGTDLVGDNYDGTNTPVPDPDPYDGCEGHGTHVSGIIAAQTNPYGFTGAAPDVTLGMYRVFGCGGSAGNDVLIAAYNQAFQDGADIITASIGGASGWSEDPWAVAVQRIVEAGVPCTVSAGNDGSYGLFYASTAANGKKVTAVASVDNTQAPYILLNATYNVGDSAPEQFGWTQGNPDTWGNVSLPLWSVNYDTTDPANACNPLPDDTPDLSGKIVLVRRGSCTFVQKVTNIAAKGAEYVMFYNNAPGSASVTAVVDGIKGIGMVTAQQGAEFISLLSAGKDVTLNIIDPTYATQYAEQTTNNATGGFLSTYTSWGPTYELDIKPQVAAPGGLILSTYPLPLGGYAVLSGTSMACPITAAIVALVSNVRGTLDPATIESLLSATGNPNVFQDGKTAYPYLAPVAQQGGGLIQAYDAAHSKTVLSVSSLAFNDTAHFSARKQFSIKNTGSKSITYSISNIGAAAGYTLPADGDIYPAPFPNELVASYADIHFSASKVTVPAGGSKTVSLTLAPPRNLNGTRLAVYSGYIALNASNGESHSLPYQGVVGSMYSATVLDPAYTYLTSSTDPDYNPVAAGTVFTIPKNSADATNETVYPAFSFSLALGTASLRADVIPYVNASAPGYSKDHKWKGHHWGHGDGGYGPDTNTESIGSVVDFPLAYQPRGGAVVPWDGLLADGTQAPAGEYTLSIKALKIFGNPQRRRDYNVVSTVPFIIKYS